MIEVQTLHKSFPGKGKARGTRTRVLEGISFKAEPGKIYGLLGTNGAGKTTTMRCIATLLKPDHGTVSVNGIDTVAQPRKVRDSIGFLTGDMKLSGNLSPRELLHFFGALNHLERDYVDTRIDELARYLNMEDFLDKQVEQLSTGMKQKASIAVALVHDPDVIMFDEPTAGLDILASKTVVDFLNDFRGRGKTVLLSTHIMAEAEKLCDTIGIILNGELVEEGSREELMKKMDKPNLEEVFYSLAQEKGLVAHA